MLTGTSQSMATARVLLSRNILSMYSPRVTQVASICTTVVMSLLAKSQSEVTRLTRDSPESLS